MKAIWDDSDDDRFMTKKEEDIYLEGRDDERDKWLPLWNAVKELNDMDAFEDSDESESYDTAKYGIRCVITELRNQGEK